MLIQILLVGAAVALFAFFLVHRGGARTKAWMKLIFVAFLALGVVALMRPDEVSVVAQWLGVGRGTDLVLYLLVVIFAFTTVGTYLRFLELDARFARLTRSVALEEARRVKASRGEG